MEPNNLPTAKEPLYPPIAATTETQSTSPPSNSHSQAATHAHPNLIFTTYDSTKESIYLPLIRSLISKDLSEPYSIYVYRYFLYQWGHLCFLAFTLKSWEAFQAALHDSADPIIYPSQDSGLPSLELVGIVINKLEPHTRHTPPHPSNSNPTPSKPDPAPLRGYIAMLAVQSSHRGQGIASYLVRLSISAMTSGGADEIVLETEVDNLPSLKLYRRLGFRRWKRLHRYYLNGNGAFRLGLALRVGEGGDGDGDGTVHGAEGEEEVKRASELRAARRQAKKREEAENERKCMRSMEYLKMVNTPKPVP